ncbi:MAG: ketoacyl-ACP synthase III [Candidatus Omnitrophica bacterium]|nr:ketoacyl-ACP synthase III [Candidatus Omnitrophota bacterium]
MATKILGIGSYVPEKVLTNKDLEKIVDTSDEWITTRTGIKERRICSPSEASSDLGYKSALNAIANAGILKEKIEMIITATITPDMPFPSTSCIMQKKLGLDNIPCFDINVACSGFIYGLEIARNFIDSGTYSTILIIATDCMSSVTDYTDRSTCILLGDGSASAVVAKSDEGPGILGSYLGASGKYAELLYMPAGGSRQPASIGTVSQRLHYMKMEGSTVYKIAINSMVDAVNMVLKKTGISKDDISLFIPHQANLRIIQSVGKNLGIPMEKTFINIERYGNMSAASVGVALDEAARAGKVRKGDIICMVAFGSGFVWASNIIKI